MPTYEIYNVETGRVVSTTDDMAEVADPLPEGLAVREALPTGQAGVAVETPTEVEESDAAAEATPDSPPEATDPGSPEGPSGESSVDPSGEGSGNDSPGGDATEPDSEPAAAPGPDADGQATPSD